MTIYNCDNCEGVGCADCMNHSVEQSKANHPAGKRYTLPEGARLLSVPDCFDGEEDLIDFAAKVQLVADTNVALLIKKHKDYGPKNIGQSPGGALNGLRVRMHDKLARINHLIDSGATPENESLADSFLDLANYAIIAQLVIRGEWPSK